MKANELMIGDWIYNKVADITFQVYPQFFSQWRNRSEQFEATIQPIPLTPKILEKNGFKEYGESWYLPDDDVIVTVGFFMYKTTIHVKRGDDIFQKEVRCSYRACTENRGVHVHTLQHALRLCGIDKEIEL